MPHQIYKVCDSKMIRHIFLIKSISKCSVKLLKDHLKRTTVLVMLFFHGKRAFKKVNISSDLMTTPSIVVKLLLFFFFNKQLLPTYPLPTTVPMPGNIAVDRIPTFVKLTIVQHRHPIKIHTQIHVHTLMRRV